MTQQELLRQIDRKLDEILKTLNKLRKERNR